MTGLIILGVVAVLAAFILLCVFLPAVGLTLLGIIVLLIVLVLNVPVGRTRRISAVSLHWPRGRTDSLSRSSLKAGERGQAAEGEEAEKREKAKARE